MGFSNAGMRAEQTASEGGQVGASHAAIVEDLLATLERLRGGDLTAPRVVILRGRSGIGKTRAIREVYQRLRDGQREPAYWPRLPEVRRADKGQGADPLPNRKRLGPMAEGFVWAADALPSFGWWALNCDLMPAGDGVDVLAQATPELRAHLPAMSLAWGHAAGFRLKIMARRDKAQELVSEALKEGGLEAAGRVLTEFGLPVPFLGLGVSWVSKGLKANRRHVGQSELLGREVDLGIQVSEARASVARSLGDLLLRIAHPQLPGVVAVEDVHLMGPELAHLLNQLAEPNPGQPLLVIATAWPEGDDNACYASWLNDVERRNQVRVLDMPNLDSTSLVALLRRHAPATPDQDAERIVARYRNPLALQLLVTSKKYRRRIDRCDGALLISAAELATLPDGVRGMYQLIWSELPSNVRESLMLAVGSLPGEGTLRGLSPFIRGVVSAAAESGGLLDELTSDDVIEALKQAEEPYEWCVTSEHLQRLREEVLADIVTLNLRDQYDDEDVLALRAATVHELTRWVDLQRADGYRLDHTDPVAAAACRWLYSLAADDMATAAVATARVTIAHGYAEARQYSEAIRMLAPGPWWDAMQPEDPETLRTRRDRASWIGRAGRPQDAAEQVEVVLADQVRILGPDHPDTLSSRNTRATHLAETGRAHEAAQQVEGLIKDQIRVLGPDHPDTLLSRNDLTSWLGRSGQVQEAVVQLKKLLSDLTRVLGPDHRDTLRTRANLATWLGRTGRAMEAVEQFQVLLDDRLRVLGPDHPATLTARNSLAVWRGETGRAKEAAEQIEDVLADRLRVLGPDHPDTLRSRSSLASWRGQTGLAEEAALAFEDLLADRVRVLGPDHPDTLRTRGSMASWGGEAGRVRDVREGLALAEDAWERLDVLLADQVRVLGPNYPDTLRTRWSLACWRGEAGSAQDAVEQLEVLLRDQVRVMSPDHPDTLKTRANLAIWRNQNGRSRQ